MEISAGEMHIVSIGGQSGFGDQPIYGADQPIARDDQPIANLGSSSNEVSFKVLNFLNFFII